MPEFNISSLNPLCINRLNVKQSVSEKLLQTSEGYKGEMIIKTKHNCTKQDELI